MGIISDSPTISTKDTKRGQSSPQNTAVGGGSRPTKSKFKIETSAPGSARMTNAGGRGSGVDYMK